MNIKIKHLMILLLSGFMLSACDKQMSESSCSSETAYKLIGQIMTEAVEKKLASEKYSNTGEFIFDKAKIRASLEQLQIAVESVRTTKEDPNSSKKFCSANLKVTIPTSMLADADQGRELDNNSKISQEARELDIDNTINVFTRKDFEYSVQPTDDGKELYVEAESGIWITLIHDITRSALLKPILEEQRAEQSRQYAQEKQEVAQLKQEAEASNLEAERLSALQEKQEADRLKQELLANQAAMVSEQKQRSFSPSFDCAKASTSSERLIYSNADLAAADVKLVQIYKKVFKNANDKETLKSEQNQWRKAYRDACTDVVCMLNAYAVRIKQLNEK